MSDYWPVLLAYLIGATPFGLLAGKMRDVDIRDHGSGNIGATNVLRVLGKPIGISVLILDILKGLAPVLIAKLVTQDSLVHILTAIAAILGHNFPFWLRFKGGKGIATSAGAIAPVLPIPLLAGAVIWVISFLVTRYVSVASIAAAMSLPLTLSVVMILKGNWDWAMFGFALFLSAMATWRHRSNIARLMAGTENQFGTASPDRADPTDSEEEPTENL